MIKTFDMRRSDRALSSAWSMLYQCKAPELEDYLKVALWKWNAYIENSGLQTFLISVLQIPEKQSGCLSLLSPPQECTHTRSKAAFSEKCAIFFQDYECRNVISVLGKTIPFPDWHFYLISGGNLLVFTSLHS